MIIKRKNFSKNDSIKLYHVTKSENIPSIKKSGLKISYYKTRHDNSIMGIKETNMLYFVLDKKKLVKPFRPGKDAIVEITLPLSIFEKMKKQYGDPEWYIYLKYKNKDYFEYRCSVFKQLDPIKFKDLTPERLKQEMTNVNYLAPDNTVIIFEDIPNKYITNIYYSV